jgi:hypothetical protein
LKKAFVSFGLQKKLAFPAIEGGKVKGGGVLILIQLKYPIEKPK